MHNPYKSLPPNRFWKLAVAAENPSDPPANIYKKKFDLLDTHKIATAGSCFAQHISKALKARGFNVMDVEPPPKSLPSSLHKANGFDLYSARYGNIYTVKQLLQLAEEVFGNFNPNNFIWQKTNGMFVDALRPSVFPDGLSSKEEIEEQRKIHIRKVDRLFREMDVFIFTLGLTETWRDRENGTVFPTAPGTIAGHFDPQKYVFQNTHFANILEDFNNFQSCLNKIRNGRPLLILLTVSPVPLTATASDQHVLCATTYSKSVLRAAAGQLALVQNHIDYFPSYEIVTNPRLKLAGFEDNLRSVRHEVVNLVMNVFFEQHQITNNKSKYDVDVQPQDLLCEEALLDAFAYAPIKIENNFSAPTKYCQIIGDSYSGDFYNALKVNNHSCTASYAFKSYPINWMKNVVDIDFAKAISRDSFSLNSHLFNDFSDKDPEILLFVGYGLLGNQIIWALGGKESPDAFMGKPNSYFSENRIYTPHELGSLCKTLPLIKNMSDCPKNFISNISERLDNCLLNLQKYRELIVDRRFFWIREPIMSEASARNRYGNDYVESGSQLLYNSIAEDIYRSKMREFIDLGIFIDYDKSQYSKYGFSLNHYSIDSNIIHRYVNQHPSHGYYRQVCQDFLNKLNNK